MNKLEAEEINQSLADIEADLNWLDGNGMLGDKRLINIVQIARPFLVTLTDIAQSLENISTGLRK